MFSWLPRPCAIRNTCSLLRFELLAWNLKTWLLNLLDLGDGAVMRFQRFRYQWIWQAGTVAKSGRNTVVLKLPAGEYFQRFGVALARLATL